MPSTILPGYSFGGGGSARYRNSATGRFVARERILDLLDKQVRASEGKLADLTTALAEHKISPAFFQATMRDELQRSHLQNRALAVGGFDKLTPRDFGAVGGRLRDDYGRIADLARGLADGSVTLPQALNRVQGYAGNARVQFFEGEKDTRKAAALATAMTLLMIRDLGVSEHCADCVGYYEQGWQTDLPSPGTQSICTTHCRCGMRYKEVAAEEMADWIGTRR